MCRLLRAGQGKGESKPVAFLKADADLKAGGWEWRRAFQQCALWGFVGAVFAVRQNDPFGHVAHAGGAMRVVGGTQQWEQLIRPWGNNQRIASD